MGFRNLFLSMLVLLFSTLSFSQEVVFVNAPREAWPSKKLIFGLEERFRYENLNNFNFLGYGNSVPIGKKDDGIFLNRVRAGVNITPSEKIRFAIWGYQANAWDFSIPMDTFKNPAWGEREQPFEERSELYKAYVEVRPFTNLRIKIGRQRIDYGDFRTFGLCNWTNTGPYLWDAVKVSYTFKNGDFIDIFAGRTKINDPTRFSLNHRHGFNGIGLYSSFSLPFANMKIEPFFAYKGDNTDKYMGEKGGFGKLNEYYIGARIWGRDFKGIDYDFWFSREFGKRGPDDISAYAYHLLVGYKLKELWATPRVSIEYTFSSGDDDPKDGTHRTYDVAYGVWGSWYGNQWSFFRWRNFKDLQFNLELWPLKGVHAVMSIHYYWLAREEDRWYLNPSLYYGGSGRGKRVGETIDATINVNLYKLTNTKFLKGQTVSATYGYFIPSEVPRIRARDKSPASWFYIQWEWKWSI